MQAESLSSLFNFCVLKGVNADGINRRVHTVDIAPTLSLLVGAKPPTGSFGAPLVEVIYPFERK